MDFTKEQIYIIYSILCKYYDNMDELLGEDYSEDLYDLYTKMTKQMNGDLEFDY